MFQQMKKRIKNEKGLTLIELLAVIVILAIIAAIAIPAIGNIIANSKAKSEISDAIQILDAAKLYELDGNVIDANGVTQANTTFKTYVDVSDRITAYAVKKNATTGAYTISFTGKQIGAVSDKSLADLTAIKVEKGKIVTTTTPPTTTP